jgi:endonuclease G, mitochondrial
MRASNNQATTRLPAVAIAVASLLLFLAGCSTTTEQVRIAYFTRFQNPESVHAGDRDAKIKRLCLFGEPQHVAGWPHGPTIEIVREGYVLEHSAADKIPRWVCEHLGPENLGGPLKRPKSEPFQADPELPTGSRAELKDYRLSGYDRGHQAPAANETKNQRLQNETYFLSNMVPQVGQFNRQPWENLEETVRAWAINRGEAYVITGPIFYDPKEDDPRTATGYFTIKAIGKDHVAVPTHIYKIVILRGRSGQWRSIALVMANKKYPQVVNYGEFIRPIRWIEERSGINFMPELDKPGNAALHEQLERQAPSEMWPENGPD